MRVPSQFKGCPLYGVLTLCLLACSGTTNTNSETTPRGGPDPSLAALDRVLAGGARGGARPGSARNPAACVRDALQPGLCTVAVRSTRTYRLRVALDPRFHAWPDWRGRLAATVGCVNRLYAATGTTWEVESIIDWNPGQDRHRLHRLLDRLQKDYPADSRTLLVGISVWEQRRVFATAGGEIGLSQGAACVVPSWPRVENDCLILAHELGHLVGARHVPGKRWLMGWSARPFHLPASDPMARVVATYRIHTRNVDSIKIYHQAKLTSRGLRLSADCRKRVRILDRCWNL